MFYKIKIKKRNKKENISSDNLFIHILFMCTIQNYKIFIYRSQIVNKKSSKFNSNSSGEINYNNSEG